MSVETIHECGNEKPSAQVCNDHNNAKDGLWPSCESKRCTGVIGIMPSEPEKTDQSKSTVAIASDRTKLYKEDCRKGVPQF